MYNSWLIEFVTFTYIQNFNFRNEFGKVFVVRPETRTSLHRGMDALLGLKRVPECSAAKVVCVLSAI